MPLAVGVRTIVKNVTATSFELWFEDTPPGVTTNLDYNDIVLTVNDWGNGTSRITLNPFGDEGRRPTHSDLVDGRTNEVIWPNLYQANGTAAGTYLFINGHVDTSSPIGDIDRNGVVDRADFKTLLNHYGLPGSFSQGDINRDGMVDFLDFQRLELTFGNRINPTVIDSPAPSEMVPEPGMLIAIPGLALLLKRRAVRS